MPKIFAATVIAAVDPTVNDDATAGYLVGMLWLNTASDTLKICTGNAAGAADWDSIGGGGGTAAGTTFTPAGTVAATNVQAAIVELDNDIQALGGGSGLSAADKIFLSQNFV